jgi:hypothetical protein
MSRIMNAARPSNADICSAGSRTRYNWACEEIPTLSNADICQNADINALSTLRTWKLRLTQSMHRIALLSCHDRFTIEPNAPRNKRS